MLRRRLLRSVMPIAALCGAVPAAAIAVTHIGTSSNSTIAIGVDIPASALIVVGVYDSNNAASNVGTLSDTVNGAHTLGPNANNNGATANGAAKIFYFWNSAAIGSGTGASINYSVGAGTRRMSAFYATGIQTSADPGEASATATGASAAPSVTSGSPTAAGELFVGLVGNTGNFAFTQDAALAWATPPNGSYGISGPGIRGGSVVNAGGTALTYAPTLGGSTNWAALVLAFKKAA